MARRASVTVSIEADNIGIFSEIFLVNLVRRSAVLGSTVECAGTSKTSSKVSASFAIRSIAISLNYGFKKTEVKYEKFTLIVSHNKDESNLNLN